jgi:rhodanese-related sulfurtransferase
MCLALLIGLSGSFQANGETPNVAFQAVLGTPAKTPEVSTEEIRKLLEDGRTLVLDARPHLEFSVSHIPGARNVAAKPGMPPAQYVSDVAEIGRLVAGDKARPLVLYCNGAFCGKSNRLADELLAAGHTDVRRYQLGIPMWRALGGVTVTEADGLRYIADGDRTAVLIDSREAAEFAAGSLTGARNIPRSGVLEGKDVGEVLKAKNDGRLPMEDHNTRLIVVGKDANEARYVAEAIAREAFHNVSFFPGTLEEARAAPSR